MTADFILLTKDEYTTGCGIGQGAQCCRFLVAGLKGLECGRFTALDKELRSHDEYVAARIPTAPYPLCQLQEKP